MITNEIFSNEILQQAPTECQHRFSDEFEHKMQSHIQSMSPECYAIAIRDSVTSKRLNGGLVSFQIAAYIVPIILKLYVTLVPV